MNLHQDAGHDADHEAVLQRWVVQEALSPEENALLAGCETCRRRRSEIESVTAELEELGAADRQAEIDAARRGAAPEWEERALLTLEQEMHGPGRSRLWSSPAWLAVGLTAAAVLIAAFFMLFDPGSDPRTPPPFFLDPVQGGIEAMSPAGEVESVEELSWKYETPPLGTYEIDLYLPGESSPFDSTTTTETQWSSNLPDPLPEHFFWEVRALDAEGNVVASGWEEVFLSPR